MKIALGLLVCFLPVLAVAEVVVPVDTVDDFVNIRMFPDAKSERVGRLQRGDSARLVQSIPEWHEIEIAGGATGFISVEWTILMDEPPLPLEVTIPTEESAALSAATAVPDTPAPPVDQLNVYAASVPAASSSLANKENVAELSAEEALAALGNLEPVTFTYAEDEDEKHVGFIAGDVPDLAAAGRKKLSTMDIVAVLTRVVQQQQQQIAELEARFDNANESHQDAAPP
jgi:hypothetical protein